MTTDTNTGKRQEVNGVNGDQYSDGMNRSFSCIMASLEGDYLADNRHNLTSLVMPLQEIRIPRNIFSEESNENIEEIMSLKETLCKNKNFENDFEKLLEDAELFA